MTIRYWPNSVDDVLALPADDGNDSAWKILLAPQSLANVIPNPSGWSTDEIFPSAVPFDEDYWRNGVVGRVPYLASSNALALPSWGYQQDDAPVPIADEEYFINGNALRAMGFSTNRRGFLAWGAGDDDMATGVAPPTSDTALQLVTLQSTSASMAIP